MAEETKPTPDNQESFGLKLIRLGSALMHPGIDLNTLTTLALDAGLRLDISLVKTKSADPAPAEATSEEGSYMILNPEHDGLSPVYFSDRREAKAVASRTGGQLWKLYER